MGYINRGQSYHIPESDWDENTMAYLFYQQILTEIEILKIPQINYQSRKECYPQTYSCLNYSCAKGSGTPLVVEGLSHLNCLMRG